MTPQPRRLALGLLRLPPRATPAQRVETRVSLALLGVNRGYSLVETFEILDADAEQNAALRAMENLVNRLDADALLVSGQVDDESVEEFAARLRLVVLRHPHDPGHRRPVR